MKYKLLSVHTEKTVNIGDYIQALASLQFLPSFDGFVEREGLNSYSEEECTVIMNGWFMHNPNQWPPSNMIHPIFFSFHINSSVYDKFQEKESISYLKKYEPIGCRDTNTEELLNKNGIKAFFLVV